MSMGWMTQVAAMPAMPPFANGLALFHTGDLPTDSATDGAIIGSGEGADAPLPIRRALGDATS